VTTSLLKRAMSLRAPARPVLRSARTIDRPSLDICFPLTTQITNYPFWFCPRHGRRTWSCHQGSSRTGASKTFGRHVVRGSTGRSPSETSWARLASFSVFLHVTSAVTSAGIAWVSTNLNKEKETRVGSLDRETLTRFPNLAGAALPIVLAWVGTRRAPR